MVHSLCFAYGEGGERHRCFAIFLIDLSRLYLLNTLVTQGPKKKRGRPPQMKSLEPINPSTLVSISDNPRPLVTPPAPPATPAGRGVGDEEEEGESELEMEEEEEGEGEDDGLDSLSSTSSSGGGSGGGGGGGRKGQVQHQSSSEQQQQQQGNGHHPPAKRLKKEEVVMMNGGAAGGWYGGANGFHHHQQQHQHVGGDGGRKVSSLVRVEFMIEWTRWNKQASGEAYSMWGEEGKAGWEGV